LQSPFTHPLHRRTLLASAFSASLWPGLAQPLTSSGDSASPVLAKRPLQFPRDLGSHPDTAIEWWYITGALQAKDRLLGFQLTFFRARVPGTQAMTSAFAAKQLIFAHAAVTDVVGQRLLHDQRMARSSGVASVDLASASTTDTQVNLHDWSLVRRDGQYLAQVKGADFAFTLTLTETQALLLQGDQGLSRKGPQAAQASYYYSLPQLTVSGEVTLAGQRLPVSGRAWLDHEWSQSVMAPQAVGWDWVGMNLDDGSALTVFRLRNSQGDALWAGGSWRPKDATQALVFKPDDVVFKAERLWKSPLSGASYPVQWTIDIRHTALDPASGTTGWRRFRVLALVNNQELDSRNSTGAIYWEGLSELQNEQGQVLGRGYLEMTGYASPLKL
jgi:predicted secreted hydrolase